MSKILDPEEIAGDWSFSETEDIQHDLAMEYAEPDRFTDMEFNKGMEGELKKRGAKKPINCRYEHDIYARFKRRLKYDLGDW